MNKLRILHLGKYDSTSPEAGGIESAIESCTQHLSDDFNQMVVVFTGNHKKCKLTQSNAGIKKLLVPVHLVAGYAPLNFFLPFLLKSVIHSFSPDIIHVHMPGIMPFFCLHELRKRITIVHWHADVEGTRVSKYWSFPVYRLFEQQLLKNADSIIATSPQYLDSSKSLKHYKQKCSVIPLGITDIADVSGITGGITADIAGTIDTATATSRNVSDIQGSILSDPEILPVKIDNFIKRRRLILSIGRFSYYKGYIFLVEAMKFVKDYNAVLLIAGEGNERQAIEQKIQNFNLDDKIMLPGKISDIEKKLLLSRAEIFCLPSIDRAEAFGVSLVEAMQFGLPLVTTRVKGSGVNYVNIHDRTGLSVQPANSFELARAINKLLNHPELAKKFGNNAKQRFIDHFQAKDMAAKIKTLMNLLI